jgi:hypothetical protein
MLNTAILICLTLFVFVAVLFLTGDARLAGASTTAFLVGGAALVIAFQIYNDEL